jgi:hypothetical protein
MSKDITGAFMRKIIEDQMQMGQIDMCDISIDVHSRDELPRLLLGLQSLYCESRVRHQIFRKLEHLLPLNTDSRRGRRGMDLWSIFVLGCVRLCCNWDYDTLTDIANNHHTLRQMLGHGPFDFTSRYSRQRLNDNLRLFTPEILDRINQIVVKHSHRTLGLSEEGVSCRCDSFVVETDVHFPTDLNLLWDAIRKTLQLMHRFCRFHRIAGWRQSRHTLRVIKRLFHAAQREQKSSRQSDKKNVEMTRRYIEECRSHFLRVRQGLKGYSRADKAVGRIDYFITAGNDMIDQIRRRVFRGKRIPHWEKRFSLFEPHTEWICKGKAGVSQQLGLQVAIMETHQGFILHHRPMQHEADVHIGQEMIQQTRRRYPSQPITSYSLDKGFWHPETYATVSQQVDMLVLPKKGRRTPEEQRREEDATFQRFRRKHAGVESGIHGLQCCGLDRCLDFDLEGFERYVALSVVARNIQVLGTYLQQKLLRAVARQWRRKKAA